MKEIVSTNTRDIARELARRYSTMTHDELDLLESILVPVKYAKGELVLKEGDYCKQFIYVDKGNQGNGTLQRRSISSMARRSPNIWLRTTLLSCV